MFKLTQHNPDNPPALWGIVLCTLAIFVYALFDTARNIGLPSAFDLSTVIIPLAPFIITCFLSLFFGDLRTINLSGVAALWSITLIAVLSGQLITTGLYIQNSIFALLNENIFAYEMIIAAIYTLIGALLSFFILRHSRMRHIGISLFSVYATLFYIL